MVKKTRKVESKVIEDAIMADVPLVLEPVVMQAEVQAEVEAPKDEVTTTESLGLAPRKEPDYPAEILSVEVKDSAPSAQKQVRINPRENHNCYIGDRWYFLRKGVQQPVPVSVKDILMRAKLLDPL